MLLANSSVDGTRGTGAAKRKRTAIGGTNRSGGGGGGLSGVINRAIAARNASLKTSQISPRKDYSRGSNRAKTRELVNPTMRNYGVYANIVNIEPDVFPGAKEERAFDTIEACEFDAFNEKSCLDEKFLHAVYVAFNVSKTLSPVNRTRSQIQGQLNGTGTYRKWASWYQQDSRLGLFRDKGVPLMIHVSFFDSRGGGVTGDRRVTDNRRVARNRFDKFSRFAQERNLRPVCVSLGRVLCANEKIVATEKPRVDSLQPKELKELRSRSLYYRRVYLAHLLVYVVLAECLRSSDRTVNLVVELRLRSLFQLPTSLSVAMRSESRINLHYL